MKKAIRLNFLAVFVLAGCALLPAQADKPAAGSTPLAAQPAVSATLPPQAQEATPVGEQSKIGKDTGITALQEPLPAPPDAALTVDGKSQSGAIGAFCWQTQTTPGESIDPNCVDAVGVPTVVDPLVVQSPVALTFDLPLDKAPEVVTLFSSPVSAADELKGMFDGRRWWSPQHVSKSSLELMAHPAAKLDLTAGLYVLELYVRWAPEGDITYGFLLQVN
jgi:hypothetical protein